MGDPTLVDPRRADERGGSACSVITGFFLDFVELNVVSELIYTRKESQHD
jgi:hypothetical protein